MICFFFPLFGILWSEPFGFYDAHKGLTRTPFRRFSRKITLSQKGRILQGMHFKAAGLGTAAHLCILKTEWGRHGLPEVWKTVEKGIGRVVTG